MSVLIFRIEGIIISCGGAESFFNLRQTDLVVTKSMSLGCLHNARGGLDIEAIPDLAALRFAVREDVPADAILDDYQNVAGVLSSDRQKRHSNQQIHKQYLCGTTQTGMFEGPRDLLLELAEAWCSPKRPIWWGRKQCVPTRPPVEDPESAVIEASLEESLVAVPLIEHFDVTPRDRIRCHIEVDPSRPLPEPRPVVRRICDVPVGRLSDRVFAYREVYTVRILRSEFPEETIR